MWMVAIVESVARTKSTPVVVPMAGISVVVTMFVYVVALGVFRCMSACGSSYDEF